MRAFGWHTGAAAGDLNGDGWPELIVTGYVDLNARIESPTLGFPGTHQGRRDLLYLSNGADGDGRPTFREVGMRAGLEVARFEYGLGVAPLRPRPRRRPRRVRRQRHEPEPALRERALAGRRGGRPGAGSASASRSAPPPPASPIRAAAWASPPPTTTATAVPTSSSPTRAGRRTASSAATRRTRRSPRSPTSARRSARPSAARRAGASRGPTSTSTPTSTSCSRTAACPSTDLARTPRSCSSSSSARPGASCDGGAAAGLGRVGRLHARGSAAADYDNDGDLDVAVLSVGRPLVLLREHGHAGPLAPGRARRRGARRRGHRRAARRAAAPPRDPRREQLPLLRGPARALRARRRRLACASWSSAGRGGGETRLDGRGGEPDRPRPMAPRSSLARLSQAP